MKIRERSMGLRLGCLVFLLLPTPIALLASTLGGIEMAALAPRHFVVAVLLATLTTLPYTLVVLWLDRNEKEPISLILVAFFWGAFISTGYSLIVNTAFGEVMLATVQDPQVAGQLSASISAPLIEEFTKGLAVLGLLVIFREQLDNVLDGIVYGALVGLGFAWFENITYYLSPYLGENPATGLGEMLNLTWSRGVVSGISSHAMFTGMTGLGIGIIRVLRRGVSRWLLLIPFLSMAMGLHFVWNTFAGLFFIPAETEAQQLLISLPLAVLVLQVPFVLLLLAVMVLVWRQEDRLIHDQLSLEPPEIAPNNEVKNLVPAKRRNSLLLKHLFRFGPVAWWHRRKLETALISLAFVRWHHRNDAVPWSADQDAEVLKLRAKILKLRRPVRRRSANS